MSKAWWAPIIHKWEPWVEDGGGWIWKCPYAPPLLLLPPHRLKGVCESEVKFRSSEAASRFALRSRCLNEDGVGTGVSFGFSDTISKYSVDAGRNGSRPPQLDSTCCVSNWTIFANYYCALVVYDAVISVSPLPARVCLSNLTSRL